MAKKNALVSHAVLLRKRPTVDGPFEPQVAA